MNRRAFLKVTVGAAAASTVNLYPALAALKPVAADSLHAEEFRRNRRFASLPSGNIAYFESGAGPAALFLHGFPLNSFQWRHAIERLSMYRRCIAPDFLGLGYTEVAEGQGVGPSDQVEMLTLLLDQLSERQVDVVANDSGGAIAQILLTRHPERIRTLLLTNCDTEIQSPPPAMLPVIALAKAGRFADEWLTPWRRDPKRARSPNGIGGMCYADPQNPTDEAIEMYLAPLLATRQRRAMLHAYAIATEHNPLIGVGSRLQQSKVPMRVVWGMADTIFSSRNADYLDATFGNSKGVRRLAKGKLFWPEEEPDILADEVRQLWGVGGI